MSRISIGTQVIFGIVTLVCILTVFVVLGKLTRTFTSKKTFTGKEKLIYSNGETVTLHDVWQGNIPEGSVFSPIRPDWYFDISGLDETGKVIFSSSWHHHIVLHQVIPKKYEDIKRWQVVVATLPYGYHKPSSDVIKKLRIE